MAPKPRASDREDLIHALREIAGALDVSGLIAGLLRDAPAAVPSFIERGHDGGPVRVALEEFRPIRAGFRSRFRGLRTEIFDVDPHDSFPDDIDPALCRPDATDV